MEVAGADFDGNQTSEEVFLLSPTAFILSKCVSVSIEKRTRDAFDIYYILSGENGKEAATELQVLCRKFPQANTQVNHLRNFLRDAPRKFDLNVNKHLSRSPNVSSASQFVSEAVGARE